MAVTFQKPYGLKYTDMCIYIDAHMSEIAVANQNPKVESKIYEYLYHVVYALACKSGYFKNFADYDAYALYAATELYFSIRKKIVNAGKEVRGKVIVPIKSSLNFIKSTMFPLKVNYQREAFAEVIDPKIHQNVDKLQNDIRESIQDQYRQPIEDSWKDATGELPSIIKMVLHDVPLKKDTLEFKNIYTSVLLTLLNDITLPKKLRNKIISKKTLENRKKSEKKLFSAYRNNVEKPILWHLDERYSNYIRLLVSRIKQELSKSAYYYIHGDDLSDDILTNIMTTAYAESTDIGDTN